MTRPPSAVPRLAAAAALALLPVLAGCRGPTEHTASQMPGADPGRGRQLIGVYACGACHIIPGAPRADGVLGPPLTLWSRRAVVAGVLPNSPAYLVRWIMTPQAVVPGNAMPDMGINHRDAADIAAYLYTIR